MNLNLEGQKIIVTGAAHGIGTAVFYALLGEYAVPIGVDKAPLAGSELDKELLKRYRDGTDYHFYQADASSFDDVRTVLAKLPDLAGIVNNAGVLGNDQSHGGRTSASWDTVLTTNAKSAYVMTEVCASKLTENRGSIVNIGSIEIDMAAPDVVLYTASKGAMWGLTVSYATTLAPRVRVNMVSPGNVNTQRNMAQYASNHLIIAGFEGRTPLGQSVDPLEVADLVLFLLSKRAASITGQNYRIDGGYTRALWDPLWSRGQQSSE